MQRIHLSSSPQCRGDPRWPELCSPRNIWLSQKFIARCPTPVKCIPRVAFFIFKIHALILAHLFNTKEESVALASSSPLPARLNGSHPSYISHPHTFSQRRGVVKRDGLFYKALWIMLRNTCGCVWPNFFKEAHGRVQGAGRPPAYQRPGKSLALQLSSSKMRGPLHNSNEQMVGLRHLCLIDVSLCRDGPDGGVGQSQRMG